MGGVKEGGDPHMTREGRGGLSSAGLVRKMLDAKSGDQILSEVCLEDKHSGKSFRYSWVSFLTNNIHHLECTSKDVGSRVFLDSMASRTSMPFFLRAF